MEGSTAGDLEGGRADDGQFAAKHYTDKSAICRYLSGERVPRDRRFLDTLLATLDARGKPVTSEVAEHLASLQLRALEVRHPHEYRVRRVQEDLETAVTSKLEAERYARALEEQLAERNREIQALAEDKTRLRAAWDAEHERLTQAIDKISRQLRMAEKWATQAERRCAQLEDELERLDAQAPADRDPSEGWFRSSAGYKDGSGIEVRDSKDPRGTVLRFTPTAWKGFIGAAQRGDFDG
jgi:hypothetical protein